MVRRAGGKGLSAEMVQQVIAKTDGVPLFVEELTKSVVESAGAQGRALPPRAGDSRDVTGCADGAVWIAYPPCATWRSSVLP